VALETQDSSTPAQPSAQNSSGAWWSLICGVAILTLVFQLKDLRGLWRSPLLDDPQWSQTPAPLVMRGGDPYIRALMRTISASESNSPRPYSLLYGGEHVQDLSHHPDLCVPIVSGPNVGSCTTAAGRYQMLTTTWAAKAEEYHPQNGSLAFWDAYSFEPEDQDEVVYRWLDDPSAWGDNLSQLLQDGQVTQVLQILSPTWTSLGYGIEDNDMSSALPQIYEEMLQEELKNPA
jgi:muramidase (phage lysozyme)